MRRSVWLIYFCSLESPIPISTEQIDQIGKSLEMTVRYPEEQGGQYAGSLEVFHQLHCLVSIIPCELLHILLKTDKL